MSDNKYINEYVKHVKKASIPEPLKFYNRADYNPQDVVHLEGRKWRVKVDVLAQALAAMPQATDCVITYSEQTQNHTATSESYYVFITIETLEQYCAREGL